MSTKTVFMYETTYSIVVRCLSNGEVPPVKDRLEYPPPETEFGLTPGKMIRLTIIYYF